MNNTLIVVNYNDFDTTSRFLESIKNYESIDSIVIVDNNSSDNSFELLKSYTSSNIKVIKTPKNGGYSYGNNYGMCVAKLVFNPKYFIISNPDVNFDESVIKELTNYLDKECKVALATGIMLDIYGNKSWIIDWGLPSYTDILQASLAYMSKLLTKKTIEKNKCLEKGDVFYVDAVPGSFFIAKSDAMNKVGYFDESTFLYCEEIILGHKLRNNDYKSAVLNYVSFEHHHSKSINKSIKKLIYQYKILQRSRKIYLVKYKNVGVLKILVFNIVTFIGLMEMRISDIKKYVKNNFLSK